LPPPVAGFLAADVEDYFDRLVRDARYFANCVRYLRRNPEKARLPTGEYELYENELAREIEERSSLE